MSAVPGVPEVLLAIETSGDVCSVAVCRAGALVAELAFRHEMHLSERLISHVDRLLTEADTSLREVNCFAVGVGPGSFTGTRIGVMTAKSWSFVLDRPIVAVNGLEAMAAEYAGLEMVTVTPVLACRRDVVYGCPYRPTEIDPVPLGTPEAYTFAELADLLRPLGNVHIFCGAAARRYESELNACVAGDGVSAAVGAVEFARASAIARLALARLAAGAAPTAALDLTPLYISPPPITMPKQPIPT